MCARKCVCVCVCGWKKWVSFCSLFDWWSLFSFQSKAYVQRSSSKNTWCTDTCIRYMYVCMYVRGCMYPCINMCLCIHGHSVCVYIWKIINNITVHTGTANVHGIVLFLCFLASCCIVVRSCLCICMRVRVRVRVCVKRLTKRRVCCFYVVSVAKSRKRKVDDWANGCSRIFILFWIQRGFPWIIFGKYIHIYYYIYIYIFLMNRSSVVRTRGKKKKE